MSYGPGICTYMIFRMFPGNFIYQIFNFPLCCIQIHLALQVILAQLSHILNLIYGAKIDVEVENLAWTDIVLALRKHYIK